VLDGTGGVADGLAKLLDIYDNYIMPEAVAVQEEECVRKWYQQFQNVKGVNKMVEDDESGTENHNGNNNSGSRGNIKGLSGNKNNGKNHNHNGGRGNGGRNNGGGNDSSGFGRFKRSASQFIWGDPASDKQTSGNKKSRKPLDGEYGNHRDARGRRLSSGSLSSGGSANFVTKRNGSHNNGNHKNNGGDKNYHHDEFISQMNPGVDLSLMRYEARHMIREGPSADTIRNMFMAKMGQAIDSKDTITKMFMTKMGQAIDSKEY
jgi:hypothetical protein